MRIEEEKVVAVGDTVKTRMIVMMMMERIAVVEDTIHIHTERIHRRSEEEAGHAQEVHREILAETKREAMEEIEEMKSCHGREAKIMEENVNVNMTGVMQSDIVKAGMNMKVEESESMQVTIEILDIQIGDDIQHRY
jgi:hypothetical protein